MSSTATAPPANTSVFLQPPAGTVSNLKDPESLAYITNVVIAVCIPIVTIFFFLRSYTRIFLKQMWLLDDWLAFIAWGGTTAYCAVMATTMAHHGGEHGWDITVAQAQDAAYWFNVSSVLYGVFICITKFAILALYRRVFSPQRWSVFDCLIVGLAAILFLFYFATTFVKIFECTPRGRIFDKSIPGTCVDVAQLLNASGLFNTITDFIILLLPVKAVWGLNMKPKQKLVVVMVFTFGLCAPIFSLVGFVVRLQISGSPDTNWNQPEILLWGAAELTTCNMCVCFPELGALLKWRRRGRASHTALNGEYTLSRRRTGAAGGAVAMTYKGARGDSDSYVELHDTGYGVRVGHADSPPPFVDSDPLDVHVTEEVTVESRKISNAGIRR